MEDIAIAEKRKVYGSMMELIGNTPLVEFKTKDVEPKIFIKLESANPTGSIKDRACMYNIRAAQRSGALSPGKTILDASSGNMACALAYFGKILGYPVHVICNSKLTEDKKSFIQYFGATLDVHGEITVEGNRLCAEMVSTEEGQRKYCFMDQLHNQANPQASYETLGPEIARDLPNVAAVVGSMGSGGSMCGTSRFFREFHPDVKIFTSQAASGTKIPGTGAFIDGDYVTPFIEELRGSALYDATYSIHLEQAQARTAEMAAQGIFVGWQGGGVLHAAIEGIKEYDVNGPVVVIIGDSGWKNMDKLKSII